MRTIIEVPDGQLRALSAWCKREGISRAEAIRRAIAAHIQPAPATGTAFGLWRDRKLDGLVYERAVRAEWEARPAWRRPRAKS